MKTSFCEKCGTKRENDALFCEQCGTKFNDEAILEAPKAKTPDTPAPVKTEAPAAKAPAKAEAPAVTTPSAPAPTKAEAPAVTAPSAPAPAKAEAPAVTTPSAPAPTKAEAPTSSASIAVLDAPTAPSANTVQAKPAEQSPAIKVVTIAVSVFLTLIIIANICMGIGILMTRELLDEENLTKICNDTNLNELKVGNAVTFNKLEKASDDALFPEWLSANLDPVAVSKYGMTADGVSKILEKSSLKEFTTVKLLEAAAYLRGETDDAKLTTDELVKLLRDNASIITEATGYEFIQEDYDNFYAFLKESNAFEDSDTLSLATDLHYAGRFTRLGLSVYSLVILGVFTLAFAIVIIVINKRNARFSSLYLGIACLVAGLPFAFAGISMLISPAFIALDGVNSELATAICDSLSGITVLSGICFTLVGAIFIAIYAIISILKKRKNLPAAN